MAQSTTGAKQDARSFEERFVAAAGGLDASLLRSLAKEDPTRAKELASSGYLFAYPQQHDT